MPAKRKGQPTPKVNGTTEEVIPKKVKVSHWSHHSEPGVVLAFGQGDVGQLGLGEDIMERKKPTLVNLDGAKRVVDVVAGGMHTVCITQDGEVYTFGCNDEGALGRDTSEDGSEFSSGKVSLDAKIIQATAGDSHTAALTEDGKVYAWGTFRDGTGPIGLTVDGLKKTPYLIPLDETFVQIASGNDHLCLLTNSGEIYTMGCGEQGQLGRIAECFSIRGGRKGVSILLEPSVVICKRVRGKGKVLFDGVWCSNYCTFARVKGAGVIYGWGLNNYHHLGLEDIKSWFTPQPIPSFNDIKVESISGGQHHSILLDKEGHMYANGRTNYGRLGLGEDCEESHIPTLISTVKTEKFTNIGCGASVSLGCTDTGDVYAWGMASNLQLGNGDEDEDLHVPTKITSKQLEVKKGIKVAAGGQHTVILAVEK
ncbi:regulator of chromosome condensation-like [Lytechinus pictus]|uniref:regulator of chromosome condensation-like n=1 Tax=Lytechinus pictus TaxID=7653 RepID=UPI0030B9EDF2